MKEGRKYRCMNKKTGLAERRSEEKECEKKAKTHISKSDLRDGRRSRRNTEESV